VSLRIDFIYAIQGPPVIGYLENVWTDGVVNLHGAIAEAIPQLTLQIEQNLAEFTTGDVSLICRNDDGWWDSTGFASAYTDPTGRYPACSSVNIYQGNALVFQGDVDFKTVKFDRKKKSVTFTVLGPLNRLSQWSAETVRRTTPSFSDFGIATSVGPDFGGTIYLQDSTKTWVSSHVTGCCLIDNSGVVWTITGLGTGPSILHVANPIYAPPNWGKTLPSAYPALGSYLILPMVFVSRYDWESSPTALSSGSLSLTDSGKAWTTNAWAGYYVFDSKGVEWLIASNTGTALTLDGGYRTGTPDVTGGTYSIRKSNTLNLLESLGPDVATLGLTGQTTTDQGDTLALTSTSGPVNSFSFGMISNAYPVNRYAATTQNAIVQFVGTKASNPALTAQELWLTEAIESEIDAGDGVGLGTPYLRDQTVSALVTDLFNACGTAISSTSVVVPSLTNNAIPYADFAGKSVMDALTELASITGCSLYCTFSGSPSGPTVTFHFQKRDAGTGSVINLSAAILERTDGIAHEWYYPSIIVQGANSTQVQEGSLRPGANQLSVSSDYVNSYAWLHQILDRLWALFGVRRATATVSVKAETAAACDIFSRVTLSGSDEWWVVKITKPLRTPVDKIDLELIASTGTTYTPSDFATVDLTSAPEPPTVTSSAHVGAYSGGTGYNVGDVVYSSSVTYLCIQAGTGKTPGSNPAYWTPLGVGDAYTYALKFTWPFLGIQSLLGFQRMYWGATVGRESGNVTFIKVGKGLTIIAGSPPSFIDVVASNAANSHYVDYQAVLADGRMSQPCPATLI
jgi:hypothetical protein